MSRKQRIKDALIEIADPREPVVRPKLTRRGFLGATAKAAILGAAICQPEPADVSWGPQPPSTGKNKKK